MSWSFLSAVFLVLAGTADVISTDIALRRGHREANPLMRNWPTFGPYLKGLVTLYIAFVAVRGEVHQAAVWAGGAVTAAIAISNMIQAKRVKRDR